jgi:hypothetical protein
MTEKVVHKTTAKKVVRRTTAKTVPARSVVSKTSAPSARKAPVRSVSSSQKKRHSPKILLIGMTLFTLVLGASALIGFSDAGQLNVENAIRERKKNATGEEQVALQSVPVEQSKNGTPNGGLVGMGQSVPEVVPVATTSTSSATSSEEQTASSTEADLTMPKEEAPTTETSP